MGEVSARKRGAKWEYYFEGAKINNQRKKISKSGFSTKKAALEEGIKAANEYINSGLHFVPSEISYNDYLNYWVDNYCKTNLKDTTCNSYNKKIRLYIKPELGKYKLKSLSAATLQEFINQKFNEGFSRNSLMSIKGILSGSINYAIHPLQFIQSNPMQYVTLPSSRAQPEMPTRKKKRMAITKEDLNVIFNEFPEGHLYHIILQLAYRCGMRLGETFALTWDCVNFNEATININKQVQNENKVWVFSNPKYDSIRKIKIDSVMLKILKQEKEKQDADEKYYGNSYTHYYTNEKQQIITTPTSTEIKFVNIRGNGTYLQPRVMQHCGSVIHFKLNNPNFDYHSLRHTHTTILIEAGANPKDVQHRLGHKNVKVTLDIYAELTEKMRNKSIEIIENIF